MNVIFYQLQQNCNDQEVTDWEIKEQELLGKKNKRKKKRETEVLWKKVEALF